MLLFEDLIKNKSINDFLVETLTEDGLIIIEILINKEDYLSEFIIAEKSGIYVNTVRKLLYKLYEHKIVSYSRKREKTRGWYIYSWKFHLKKLLLKVMKIKQEQVLKLKNSLIPETSNQFFYCKDCDLKIDFAAAMENNFICTSCDKPMIVYSPEAVNKKVKKDIVLLKEELIELQKLWEKAKVRVSPPEVKEKKRVKVKKPAKKPSVKKVTKKAKLKTKPVKTKVSKPKTKPSRRKAVELKPLKKKKSFWDKIRGK